MKKTRIVIPALGLIAFSTAASITGTVAWFTANNSVTVTGMAVKTKVGNNLLIADDQTGADFTDAVFASSLEQTRQAKLEPVSTIDGLSFYYTTVSNDDGTPKASSPFYAYSEATAQADTDAAKAAYDANFNTKYGSSSPTAGYAGTVLYGYVDYTFYLKATFTSSGDKIVMDKCNFLYNSAALGATDLSWRVAVFAHAAAASTNPSTNVTTVTTYTTAMADGDRITILAPEDADYNYKANGTSNTAADGVSGLGAARGDGNAQTYADVKDLGEDAVIYTTTAANEKNKVFKVVVRLWLEGEDTKCFVDNYKSLTDEYTLDIGFKVEENGASPSAAVTEIGSDAA